MGFNNELLNQKETIPGNENIWVNEKKHKSTQKFLETIKYIVHYDCEYS